MYLLVSVLFYLKNAGANKAMGTYCFLLIEFVYVALGSFIWGSLCSPSYMHINFNLYGTRFILIVPSTELFFGSIDLGQVASNSPKPPKQCSRQLQELAWTWLQYISDKASQLASST